MRGVLGCSAQEHDTQVAAAQSSNNYEDEDRSDDDDNEDGATASHSKWELCPVPGMHLKM